MRTLRSGSGLFATLLVVASGVVIACSSDGVVDPGSTLNSEGATTKPGDAGKTATTPPVAGPLAKFAVSPRTLSLKVGKTETLKASAADAAGVAITGRIITWRTSNAAIATVSDGGVVTARAVGSVWVVGSIEQYKDSANVTVTSAEVAVPVATGDTTKTATTTPTTTAATTFSPYFTVLGELATSDGTKTEPLGGVVITATRTTDGTPPVTVVAATATTEASGHITMKGLPVAVYTITATPPAGSPYQSATITSAKATGDPHIDFVLKRK